MEIVQFVSKRIQRRYRQVVDGMDHVAGPKIDELGKAFRGFRCDYQSIMAAEVGHESGGIAVELNAQNAQSPDKAVGRRDKRRK